MKVVKPCPRAYEFGVGGAWGGGNARS